MTRDSKLVAAVIAAVEAYLNAESRGQAAPRAACVGAWRLAGRGPGESAPFGRGLGWRNID